MINNVAFTGREAMLTGRFKASAKAAEEALNALYTGAGKQYSAAEIAAADRLSAQTRAMKPDMTSGIESYVASHQPIMTDVPAAPVEAAKHIDFFG